MSCVESEVRHCLLSLGRILLIVFVFTQTADCFCFNGDEVCPMPYFNIKVKNMALSAYQTKAR